MNWNKATGFHDPLDGRGEREEGKQTSKLRSRGQQKEETQRTWAGPRAVIKVLSTRTDSSGRGVRGRTSSEREIGAHSGHTKHDMPVGISQGCQDTVRRV